MSNSHFDKQDVYVHAVQTAVQTAVVVALNLSPLVSFIGLTESSTECS